MENIINNYLTPKFDLLTDGINLINKYRTNKEDWFMINILSELDKLNVINEISDLAIEKNTYNGKAVDIYFKKNEKEYYIELKHWRDKYKNGNNYPISSWLSKGGGYVKSDLEKLKYIKNEKSNSKCYLMIVYTYLEDTNENIKEKSEKFKTDNNIKFINYASKGYNILLFEI